jgi:hypothetical protein
MKADGLWMGVPVSIIRQRGMWVTVKFLENCQHFHCDDVVCLSDVNIIQRTPISLRTPVLPKERRSYGIH